jgi:phosphatidylserine/phosphatidylglycerophosphate/cardiolipin synthase-like enzyme
VRVLQAELLDSRLAVVDRLVAMRRGGCKVWVATHRVEPEALARLQAVDIPVHLKPIHDKSFLVYGKVGGEYQYRVYTGSQNMSYSAAHRFDEIFVKLAAETGDVHPVYDAYMIHFSDAYDDGEAL